MGFRQPILRLYQSRFFTLHSNLCISYTYCIPILTKIVPFYGIIMGCLPALPGDYMVKKLYFLRHGLAYDREEWHGENDDLRPLTDEGTEAMKSEAKYLKQINLKLDAIVTSPLVRARDTAKIVAKALHMEYEEDALLRPEFNLDALEQILTRFSTAHNLMIVGHEPSFSQVAGQLIGGGTVVMKKGGLARVDLVDQHPPRGELVWLLTPKLLKD
jgi:phosphohistidine phosphatase